MLPLFRWIGCGDVFVSVVDVTPKANKYRRRVKIFGVCEADNGHQCVRMYQATAGHVPDASSHVTWGRVDCGYWNMPVTPSGWCLVSVAIGRWSFNGTRFPDHTCISEYKTECIDCMGMRSIMDALHAILARPIAIISASEEEERNNIIHECVVRMDVLRWMHVLLLSSCAAGAHWYALVTSAEPIARGTRIRTLQVTQKMKQHCTRDDIARRQCDTTPVYTYHNDAMIVHHRDSVLPNPMNVGSECIQYLGWVSTVVHNLLEECIIFMQTECQIGECVFPTECNSAVCDTPDAQLHWLETCESTDRLTTLDDAWAAWIRQRSALRAAYLSIVHRWEQFQFTVDTYGCQRLSLFEQAKIGGSMIWAVASIERAQILTIHSVAHLTPQLGSQDRIRFCRSVVTVLLNVCCG
jgi:hypothetical protein